MRLAFMAILAAILLLGCASQQTETPNAIANESGDSSSGVGGVGGANGNEMAGLDTASISFSRNASDVINTQTEFPEIPEWDFSAVRNDEGGLIVYYFYSPFCVASKALAPEIDRMEAAYPDVEFRRFDISTQNGTWAYLDFAEQFNLSTEKRLVPQVLVDGKIIIDRFNINGSLEGIIGNH